MSLLAITRAAGMIAAYGTDGYSQIQNKLAGYQSAVVSPSVNLVVLDDAVSMSQFGGVAAGADAASLQAAVARIASRTGPEGILILGGADIVPQFQIANPVLDRSLDPDPWVYTDNPYGLLGAFNIPDSYDPPILVGRICTGAGDTANAFCGLIDSLIANHNKPPVRVGYVEITNRVWLNSSSSVASALAGAGRVLVCPNDNVTAGNASSLDCKFLYCNLHGFNNDPGWKGADPVRGYLTALNPQSFWAQFVSGTIVYTEACYGLQTAGRPTSGSCALTLLAQGAAAVVGATGLAFGTAPGPAFGLVDADLLTQQFFLAALGGGRIGDCLRQARSNFSSSGTLDVYQQKTLLEFQLLGDPTLALF